MRMDEWRAVSGPAGLMQRGWANQRHAVRRERALKLRNTMIAHGGGESAKPRRYEREVEEV